MVDTKSIILASGNKSKVKIACADTGSGIISQLALLFPNLKGKNSEILAKSLQKGVTSKVNSYHMGYGLWIVNEIVKHNNSRLHVYSEGYYYKNDYGKITTGRTGFWAGTIVYINLDITKPQTMTDFNIMGDQNFDELKIKFS